MALLKFSNVPHELAQPIGMWVRLKKWPLAVLGGKKYMLQ